MLQSTTFAFELFKAVPVEENQDLEFLDADLQSETAFSPKRLFITKLKSDLQSQNAMDKKMVTHFRIDSEQGIILGFDLLVKHLISG